LSEFAKLRVVASYEFLKHIRRKRLYIIMALTFIAELAVIVLMPALMGKYPDDAAGMAALLTIGPSLAAIGAVFFSGDAIAGEFEGKTGFILFTNPVKRVTLVTGKYLAGVAAIIILVVFGYLITGIALQAIYGEIPSEIWQSFGLCLLFACSVISITFFFSSISKSAMSATIISLVLLMVLSGIIGSVLSMADQPYWFLPAAGGDNIAYVYGGVDLFIESMMPEGAAEMYGMEGMNEYFSIETPDIGLTAWGTTGYLIIGFILSLWISRRRQLA
jgi:ABC-2 type transport system permease protein